MRFRYLHNYPPVEGFSCPTDTTCEVSCHSCDGQSALLSATKAATEPTKAAQPLMGELRLRGWMRPYGAFELDICSQTPP
ncbi:hypothetical protein NC651_001064 [Populus alba x Populus x berolinensis]|nr:hypothetical protein NC651_001064 [Populus alba x Populus x berolinensis]